ncbi:TRAP transporter substrate-binding protein DctP [Roseobacter sp. YSTF-M11]|uniref:TRAP transporter substrate-binding protein DctP n=1 Tax=Roseobacter insulae TaxID=2859783 RepID=A0A9X1JWN8_9RHOB|nr:TRAP transporter substrate-binding protein DctP [Roseobacter insulae]MBW4706365.1 TRAP transporter substrate-binding protein DctP [Roseobacter insulae]
MKRLTSRVAAIALCTMPFTATAETLDFTIGSPLAPVLPWVGALPNSFVANANTYLEEAGSELRIDWTEAYSGTLYKFQDTLESVESGIADVGWVGTIWEVSNMPLMQMTFSTPFASQDLGVSLSVVNDIHREIPEMQAAWEDFNQVFLGAAGVETYHIYSVEPIETLDDLQGLKLLGGGAVGSWIQAAGATWVEGSTGTFYQQMQTGVADGAVIILSAGYPNRFHEVAPNLTLVGLGAQVIGGATINLDRWNAMTEVEQDVFRRLGEEYSLYNSTKVESVLEDYMSKTIAEGGIVTEMADAEKLRWAEAMSHLPQLYLEQGGDIASKVLSAYMSGVRAAGQTPLVNWDENL